MSPPKNVFELKKRKNKNRKEYQKSEKEEKGKKFNVLIIENMEDNQIIVPSLEFTYMDPKTAEPID